VRGEVFMAISYCTDGLELSAVCTFPL